MSRDTIRAESNTKFQWGDEIDDDYLWYAGNSPREIPQVGKKKPNAWGLHDMMGNVWEWTMDCSLTLIIKVVLQKTLRGLRDKVSELYVVHLG